MEHGKEDVASKEYAVLMEHDPVSRLKTQHRSLRRQMCLIQFMTVFLCISCCLFTLMYQPYASSCKENEIKKAPEIGMQRQAPESDSREDITLGQSPTRFTRLTIKQKPGVSGAGNVTWILKSPEPDHKEYFTLDNDCESLKVHRDGTYKVSLQIMYRGLEGYIGDGEQSQHGILHHEIHHYTDSYPRVPPLLTYMETVNFKSPYWKKTLFSEGIFSLNTGDRLKVWSSHLILIDVGEKVEQKTFFVAYPHFFS
ncbi:uncharacterized protein si:ch211-158d24.4 isoform X1 [Myxocyprinus asiaticus]|uniref:uncharacterized protein si:ch211-158d24.4 isoform X1 n=1 Tax=Myxocyprinus asiaticus TaxID=70543 RepID=UPI002222CED6|nr:uncharacterized protein si:ch211-158d24.4 isoform X1 [Myxocyprinus asiaticus]